MRTQATIAIRCNTWTFVVTDSLATW